MAQRKRPSGGRGHRPERPAGAGPASPAPPDPDSSRVVPVRPNKALLAAAVVLEAAWLAALGALAWAS